MTVDVLVFSSFPPRVLLCGDTEKQRKIENPCSFGALDELFNVFPYKQIQDSLGGIERKVKLAYISHVRNWRNLGNHIKLYLRLISRARIGTGRTSNCRLGIRIDKKSNLWGGCGREPRSADGHKNKTERNGVTAQRPHDVTATSGLFARRLF